MADKSEEKAVRRDEKGRFLPGSVPKSPGRPALAKEFKERCRQFMNESGWQQLVAMAKNPKSKFHFKALELIAHYAYGKPTQPLSSDEENPLKIVLDLL